MALSKIERKQRIKNRIKKVISGTAQRPRLAVFRSNNEIYAQIIDDTKGITLVAASSRDKEINTISGTKTEKSKLVGELIAKKAKVAGIETISFDRGGYLYHGRVKALAEGAREAGLKF